MTTAGRLILTSTWLCLIITHSLTKPTFTGSGAGSGMLESVNSDQTTAIGQAENVYNAQDSLKLKLLILVPLNQVADDNSQGNGVIQTWDRGLEMLPGAQIAVKAINSDPHLLPGYQLDLMNESVGPCTPPEVHSSLNAFVPFVKKTLASNIVGMLGLYCDRLLRILSPLAGRKEFGLFQLSGTTSTDVRGKRARYTHLNFALPSEAAYYETMFVLMNTLRWRRALIIEDKPFNIKRMVRNASLLTQNLDISFIEYSDLTTFTMTTEIRWSEKNIVLVSVGSRQAANVLCRAYDDGLMWPHYVWILQDQQSRDLLEFAHGDCRKGKLMQATQNAILLRFQYEQKDSMKELVTGTTYKSYLLHYMRILNNSDGTIKHNPYANTMHDSVWAFALALNQSLDSILRYNMTVMDFVNEFGREQLTNSIEDNLRSLSFEGVSGHIQFNDHYDIEALVNITLVGSNGVEMIIGHYDQSSSRIFLNKTLIPFNLPPDKLPNIYNQIPIPAIVSLVIIAFLCLIFTTLLLVLFIKYRRYSEIKATSPFLSLLMFAGTYFMLISTLIQAVLMAIISPNGNAVSALLCGSVISGNVIGINLVFSTLLLRMLRVYRIFSYFGKTGKVWSDKVLIVIVLSIVSGDVVLLLIWFNVDPFTMKNLINYKPNGHPPHYEISQYCSSDTISVWFLLIFGKVGLLFAIVLFLAIRTRKIQRSNFKDTKKVNMYIFLTVIIIATLIPVWFLLKETGNVLGTSIVVYIAFGMIGLFCQFALFTPKLFPPLLRSMGFKVGVSPRSRCRKTIRKGNKRNLILKSSSHDTSFHNNQHPCLSALSSNDQRNFSTITIINNTTISHHN